MAFLGQFDTLQLLINDFPTGTKADYAFVGTGVNKIEYRWSEDGGGAWYDSQAFKGNKALTFGYEDNPSFTDEIGYLRKTDGTSRRLKLKKAWKNVMTQKGDLVTLDVDNETPIRIPAGANGTVLRYINGQIVPSVLNDLYPVSSETTQGINQIATQQEYFNKNNTKTVTAANIANDVRNASFSVSNSITGLNISVAPNTTYNLLTALTEAGELQNGSIAITYKNISNITQSKILDEVNNKFLLFSALHTLNSTYYHLRFMVQVTYNITTTTNQTTMFYIRLRRVVDNSIVTGGTILGVQHNVGTRTNETLNGAIPVFVNGELNPLVLDGCYLSFDNDSASSATIVITGIDIIIFKD